MLKALYDADLAEEDVILAWAGKTDAAAILGLDANATKDMRRAAAPFVSWLEVRFMHCASAVCTCECASVCTCVLVRARVC